MAEAALETVLRRDRIIVGIALAGLAALAWAYVLWLAADMDMGGMDMTGFRMIPAGLGIMAPANAPWGAIEFGFVFAMWAVMMVGMMAPSAAPMILMYARVGRQGAAKGTPFAATGWFAAGYFLLDRFLRCRDSRAVGARTRRFARRRHGERQPRARSSGPDRGGRLSVDAAQGHVPYAMPDATPVPDAPRRLSSGRTSTTLADLERHGIPKSVFL